MLYCQENLVFRLWKGLIPYLVFRSPSVQVQSCATFLWKCDLVPGDFFPLAELLMWWCLSSPRETQIAIWRIVRRLNFGMNLSFPYQTTTDLISRFGLSGILVLCSHANLWIIWKTKDFDNRENASRKKSRPPNQESGGRHFFGGLPNHRHLLSGTFPTGLTIMII